MTGSGRASGLPARAVGKIASRLHRTWLLRLRRPVRNLLGGKGGGDVLYAFYDKAVSPTTFDFVIFLVLAERERLAAGCSFLHVVFAGYDDVKELEREGEEFRTFHGGTSEYDGEFFRRRLRNILLPCCKLIPACRETTVCGGREEASVLVERAGRRIFPREYLAEYPVDRSFTTYAAEAVSRSGALPSLRAPAESLDHVRTWLRARSGGRKTVTVTLREASYNSARNSDLESWGAFIESLDTSRFFPVVIRDTEADAPLPPSFAGAEIFHEGARDTLLRAAMYEESCVNLMVSNGPAALCYCNDRVRYLVFKFLADATVSSREFIASRGLREGDQWFSRGNEFQKFVWKTDSADTLREEFEKFLLKLEGVDGGHRDGLPAGAKPLAAAP